MWCSDFKPMLLKDFLRFKTNSPFLCMIILGNLTYIVLCRFSIQFAAYFVCVSFPVLYEEALYLFENEAAFISLKGLY